MEMSSDDAAAGRATKRWTPQWMTTGHWTTPYYGYVQTIEEAETALKNFSSDMESKYIVYQKDKTFGAPEFNPQKSRIFFQVTEERQANSLSVWPEFDGIPFIVLGRKFYGCHLGKDKDYGAKLKLRETKEDSKKEQSPKVNLRATKKMGCPAKISMAQIIKFPQYKVKTNSELQRRATFKKLRSDLTAKPTSVKGEVRFYIRFNKPGDHVHTRIQSGGHGHTVGQTGDGAHTKIGSPQDNMDYRLVRHLCKLYHQGVTRLSEIESALKQYINHQYPNGDVPSEDVCPELYPDRVELRYHLNNAQCIEQLIHIDTKIFNKVVDEWRQLYPTHSFYYQAYVKEDTKTEQQVKEHQYARDMVEPAKLQSFMFCYQSDIQQRLLARFGQNLTVLDLAKKVPVPTYFLMVRTNTCYQVVAIISLQFPDAHFLKLALEFLRECNPGWEPQYFMAHNTQQDIAVLQDVFPKAEVHIIDSCRESSWNKWLEEEKKGKTDQQLVATQEVYRLLQQTATSKTEKESSKAWEKLTETDLWKNNARFRYYMMNTWKKSASRWTHYSRSESLLVTLLANDGLKQLTSALKHDWLDDMKTRSLTEIFSGMVSEYLPAHYCKHMSQNLVLPALASYNTNKKSIPDYIKPTPPIIQTHIMELVKSLPRTAQVSMDVKGLFNIQFPDDPKYRLSFGNESRYPSCECPEWQSTRMVCRHFCTIFGSFPEWGWSSLSVRYTNNPIFAVDEESLPAEIQTLYKVDNLQKQADIAQRALQVVRMESSDVVRMEESEDAEVVTQDDTDNLSSPIESDTENTEGSSQIVFESIADTDILVAASETVLETEPEMDASTQDSQRTEDVGEVTARCKHHLETLSEAMGQMNDVDALLKLEEQLVELCGQVGQRHDKSPRKRRKVDHL